MPEVKTANNLRPIRWKGSATLVLGIYNDKIKMGLKDSVD